MTTHDHHSHHHSTGEMSDARLIWAIIANMLLTIAQIIGGIISNSLALVADALHNLNDGASLILALVARRIGRMPPDERRTFGYRKVPVVGALINLTTLILVGIYLIYEAIVRFFEQPEIGGWIVVIIAAIALIVDVVTAVLTYSMSKESMNIKAAFVHNVSDALASVGVIIAGSLILLFDLYIADLIVTLVISVYILYQGFFMIGDSIRILIDSTPKGISLNQIVKTFESIAEVQDLHHVHVWHLDEDRIAFEGHVTVGDLSMQELEELKKRLKDLLKSHFDISHATLEFEYQEADEHDKTLLVLS